MNDNLTRYRHVLVEVLECVKKESPNIVIQRKHFNGKYWEFLPYHPELHNAGLYKRIRQHGKLFSRNFMTLDFLAITLEARSFSCFVWTGTLEALMSETNKCLAKKLKRNIDVGYPLRDAEASYLTDPLLLFKGKRMLCGRNRITIEYREGRRGDGHIGQVWVLRFKASNHNNSSPHLESNTDLQHHIKKGYTYAIDNDVLKMPLRRILADRHYFTATRAQSRTSLNQMASFDSGVASSNSEEHCEEINV
ncbi:hypothetical protein OUZ56_011473 [Daphnia magna]|uniref:Uncharacterized protein n=1 Tax=Daphnia magna TaxID=35525 RepID=A0ABQ9Z077_9CRUS|nr:hypothetical protein OUZ56_011473 [Daphnia magna]